MKKSILVTGGTGYLGSSIIKRLYMDYDIILIKRTFDDFSKLKEVASYITIINIDEQSLKSIFDQYDINYILHLATVYGRNNESIFDIVTCNLSLPLEIYSLAVKYQVEFFINIDTVLDKFTNNYSLSKKQLLEWLQYSEESIMTINIKLENFYGPGDADHKFITAVIHKMLRNEAIINLTKGEQRRDFLFIDDLVDFFELFFKKVKIFNKNFSELTIGSGVQHTIKESVLLISKHMNCKSELAFGAIPYRSNELMEISINIDNLKDSVGWNPKTALSEGLQKTIDYERKLMKQ